MAELRVKGTGTLKLFENDNTSSVTIASPASLSADRTVTLPDASVTLASGTMLATDGDGSSLTGLPDNTPAFSAYLGSAQTPSESTYTKVAIDTEYYDTDSAFDKDTEYRFTVPSGGDGNYFFYGKVEYTATTANSRLMVIFYLNGARIAQGRSQASPGGTTDNYAQVSWSVDLSESDYVELWTYYDGEGTTRSYETPKSTFTGFKLAG